jgi:chemotaxis methyl-accepting protein methylase
MKEILQTTQSTDYDRYPHVFRGTKMIVERDFSALDRSLDILSFGCSSGEEIKSLKDKYIPNANYTGVDINEQTLIQARESLKNYDGVRFVNSLHFNLEDNRYDVIFCLSVLCRHLVQKNEPPLAFSLFDDTLISLDKRLNIGGYLVIYNSNYCVLDSSIGGNYEPVYVATITESNSKVQMYCKDGVNLRELGICLFKKMK